MRGGEQGASETRHTEGEGLGREMRTEATLKVQVISLLETAKQSNMANSILTTLKLVLVLAVVAGGAYAFKLLLASVNDAVK